MGGIQILYNLRYSGRTSARDVPQIAVGLSTTRPALKLVEVRVVDNSSLDTSRDPIEGCVAFGAPHLVTPRNLENHSATCGTWLGILVKQFDGLDVVGVTFVILTFVQFITVLTDLGLAEFALPLVRKETATVTNWTLPNEVFLGSGGISIVTRAKPSNLSF